MLASSDASTFSASSASSASLLAVALGAGLAFAGFASAADPDHSIERAGASIDGFTDGMRPRSQERRLALPKDDLNERALHRNLRAFDRLVDAGKYQAAAATVAGMESRPWPSHRTRALSKSTLRTALANAETRLAENPDAGPDARFLLARVHLALGDEDAAVESLETAVRGVRERGDEIDPGWRQMLPMLDESQP